MQEKSAKWISNMDQLYGSAGRISWTDQLDGPVGRTSSLHLKPWPVRKIDPKYLGPIFFKKKILLTQFFSYPKFCEPKICLPSTIFDLQVLLDLKFLYTQNSFFQTIFFNLIC